jgi:opine dehydrogenase
MGKFIEQKKKIICICGGGNLGHTLATIIGSRPDIELRLLTRSPEKWKKKLKIIYRNSFLLYGKITIISNNPADVIEGSSIVIIAVPSTSYKAIYYSIQPFLKPGTWVGAIPGTGGFEWISCDCLEKGIIIFGMQRSPYNCKIKKYGSSVNVMGVRGMSYLGSRPAKKSTEIAKAMEYLLQIPVAPLANYLNVTLAPANSLLHPCRMYSLFRDWKKGMVFPKLFSFYEKWDNASSNLFLKCDTEIQNICKAISLDLSGIITIKTHYDIETPAALSKVIRNIRSLKKIKAPLKKTLKGWIPDIENRFFTEDLSINLLTVKAIAEVVCVHTPVIDSLLIWGAGITGVPLLQNNKVVINESNQFQLPAYPDLTTKKELLAFYLKSFT